MPGGLSAPGPAGESSSGKGRRGEEIAAAALEAEGWRIVARNFRSRRGEVDIIGEKGGVLAFVEVKNWGKTGPEDLERAIGADKRGRIVETAKIFLSRHREYNDRSVRFDVVLVRDGAVAERYPSAFTGEL